MRCVPLAQWGFGFFILFAASTTSCRHSDAAQTPSSKPPPETPGDQEIVPIPPESGLTRSDIERRTVLLSMLKKSKLPLFQPEKVKESEALARAAFDKTFRANYLPQDLRDKVTIGDTECGGFGCSVDVTYPDSDWTTFTALDRLVLNRRPGERPSPFMSFPGPRYRTGRVKIGPKTVASWILAFRVRDPDENQGSHWKEGQ